MESPKDASEADAWLVELRAIAESEGRLNRAERKVLDDLVMRTGA